MYVVDRLRHRCRLQLEHCDGTTPSPAAFSLPLTGVVSGWYNYMETLLQLDSCTPHNPPLVWPCSPNPLRSQVLAQYLAHHPDQRFVQYIKQELDHGFCVGFSRYQSLRSLGRNHPSTAECPEAIRQHLQTEIQTGHMVGPVHPSLSNLVHVSPLGLVPKSDSTAKWRVIVDLSAPRVNEGVDPSLCSLRYASIDDAVDLIRKLGVGTLLLKMDLKDAYRIVPVYPDEPSIS